MQGGGYQGYAGREASPDSRGGGEYTPLLAAESSDFSNDGRSGGLGGGLGGIGTLGSLGSGSRGGLGTSSLEFGGTLDSGGHGDSVPSMGSMSGLGVGGPDGLGGFGFSSTLPGASALTGKAGLNRGGKDALGKLDIVQFAAPFTYVVEGTDTIKITAMRIGHLQGVCSVEFYTEDNSAKAGMKYREKKGKIDFEAGQEFQDIEIEILSDDSFDTNLDFKVVMENASNALLGEHGFQTRVVIIDDDVFPGNEFRSCIEKEEMETYGARMLIAFMKFAFKRIPLVGWRSGWTMLLDQFNNFNYLLGIWLNIYLVDVVFAVHKPESEEELWVPKNRLWTAVLVALGLIIPKAVLTWIDLMKIGDLAVGGKVRLHLKVNLFRKYLYYSQTSHTRVTPQELTKAMEGDINELVMHGFLVLFQLAQQIIKVGVILYFLVRKRPSSALPLLVYPIAMAVVLNLRYERTLQLKDLLRDSEKDTMTCLRQSCDDIGLIKEYNMRASIVNRYENSIKAQGPRGDDYSFYDYRTMMVMPWITNFAIAIFMIVGGKFVLEGGLSLGAYLATIGIYKDAGELFGGFYGHLKECYSVIGPLLRVVRLLSLESDVGMSMEQNRIRTEGMQAELREEEHTRRQHNLNMTTTSRFDMLHLKMVNCSLATDRGGPQHPALQDLTCEVPQGKMVAILGPHGSGKYSILRLITGLVIPVRGSVQVPTYLRCLCVPNVPELFRNGGLLENLTFGTYGKYDKSRLVKLCAAVGLGEHTMNLVDKDLKEEAQKEKAGDLSNIAKKMKGAGVPWYEQLSQSELLKMHITRALNLNPEVLLLHRPVDEMEADHAARVLDVFRQHVDHRGLFLAPDKKAVARPHTVFFTSGEDRERAESAQDVADVVWHVSDKGFSQEPGGRNEAAGGHGPGGHGKGGNKIVNSWSREVRSLQVDLEKAKHAHQHTQDQLDTHKDNAEHHRTQADVLRAQLNDVVAQAKRALRDVKTYESEMDRWEASGGGFMTACGNRGQPPSSKAVSRILSEMIASGEGKTDAARGKQGVSYPPPGGTTQFRRQ